jgi:L-asparagine transporter-like permease
MHSFLSVEEVSAESRNNLDSLWTFLQVCIELCVLIGASLYERILAIASLHFSCTFLIATTSHCSMHLLSPKLAARQTRSPKTHFFSLLRPLTLQALTSAHFPITTFIHHSNIKSICASYRLPLRVFSLASAYFTRHHGLHQAPK